MRQSSGVDPQVSESGAWMRGRQCMRKTLGASVVMPSGHPVLDAGRHHLIIGFHQEIDQSFLGRLEGDKLDAGWMSGHATKVSVVVG